MSIWTVFNSTAAKTMQHEQRIEQQQIDKSSIYKL